MRRAVVVLGAVLVTAILLPIGEGVSATRTDPVPILMYHAISEPPPNAPFPGLYVSPNEFAAEMAALGSRGYHPVTLGRVFDHWRDGKPLPRRPIVITFDDGYRSVYENALPVLRTRGWPAVLNMELRFIDRSWGLSRKRIRALIAAGWELGSHTINHPDLTTVGEHELTHEVLDSRFTLQRMFRVPVPSFCYPAGRYDTDVVAAVRAAGYRGATSTRNGLGKPQELFTLARVRVDRDDGTRGLLRHLAALGG